MRVPTVAWWPGKIPAGTEADAVTGMMDILPTLVAIETRGAVNAVKDDTERQWYDVDGPERIGVAAPVTRLLGELRSLVD